MSVVEKLESLIENILPKAVVRGEFEPRTMYYERLLKWVTTVQKNAHDVEVEFVAFKKAELQRKASVVFKIRKMIDDWSKEYCIDKKCAGLLDCKLCLECEIGMRKGAYKDVLKILDKPPMEACVIVPRKKLQEKIDSCPDCSIQVHLGRVCPKHKWIKELIEERTK